MKAAIPAWIHMRRSPWRSEYNFRLDCLFSVLQESQVSINKITLMCLEAVRARSVSIFPHNRLLCWGQPICAPQVGGRGHSVILPFSTAPSSFRFPHFMRNIVTSLTSRFRSEGATFQSFSSSSHHFALRCWHFYPQPPLLPISVRRNDLPNRMVRWPGFFKSKLIDHIHNQCRPVGADRWTLDHIYYEWL